MLARNNLLYPAETEVHLGSLRDNEKAKSASLSARGGLALLYNGMHQDGDEMTGGGARGSGWEQQMSALGRLLGGINGSADHSRAGDDATRGFGGRETCRARDKQGEIWTLE